jgi:hypothetical protein
MGLLDVFKKKTTSEMVGTHNLGGCVVTKSILEGKSTLKWLFREKSVNSVDNGWRALGDNDTQEYIDDSTNSVVVDFDRLVEIEPAVLSVYDMPVGTDLEFVLEGKCKYFIDSKTGNRI